MDRKDNLRAIVRARRQARRLGAPEPCQGCGEVDPRCLTRRENGIRCYACQRVAARASAFEKHHLAGQHNLAETALVPANDHRILSDMQNDWPETTMRNSDRSPLLIAAAAIRGWLDVLQLIIERTVGWIPAFLEGLDAWLRVLVGDGYWTRSGFPRWPGAMTP